MIEAVANISWLLEDEAVSLVVRCHGYTEEYARVWIAREEKAGRLKSRRRTVKKWHLRTPDRDIYEFYGYDLAAAGLLPTPRGEVAEGTRWKEAQAQAWAALGEPLDLSLSQWPSEMDGKIKPIQLELRRQTGAERVRAWGRPPSEETLRQMPADLFRMPDPTLIIGPHGRLGTEPPGELWKYQDRFQDRPWSDARGVERDANEIIRVFPKLLPIPAAEWLTKLDAVIALETNRTDWTRLVELVALIGGNPENSTQEENAVVRLVVGFDYLSARVGAELHPPLHEAEEIVRRVWDRSGEAVRAERLVVKGRTGSNLKVAAVPATLVPVDLIRLLLLLRSDEQLAIGDQRYIDIRIGPSEQPEEPGDHKEPPPSPQPPVLKALPKPPAPSSVKRTKRRRPKQNTLKKKAEQKILEKIVGDMVADNMAAAKAAASKPSAPESSAPEKAQEMPSGTAAPASSNASPATT